MANITNINKGQSDWHLPINNNFKSLDKAISSPFMPVEVDTADGEYVEVLVASEGLDNVITLKTTKDIRALLGMRIKVNGGVSYPTVKSLTGAQDDLILFLQKNQVYTFVRDDAAFRWVCTNYRDDLGVVGHTPFTPTLTAPSGIATYHHNEGESFEIGKLITTFFSIYVKSSTLKGNVYINGFPVKSSSSTTFDVEEPISAYGLTNVTDSGFSSFLRVGAGTDSFRIGYAYKSGSNNIGVAILSGDQVKDGTVIRGKISYITD